MRREQGSKRDLYVAMITEYKMIGRRCGQVGCVTGIARGRVPMLNAPLVMTGDAAFAAMPVNEGV